MQKCSLVVLFVIFLWSCKKDPNVSGNANDNAGIQTTNNVDFRISNVVGTMPLALDTQTYVNQNQDTFTVSLFRYYISNIKLKRDDGYEFVEPESYRLVTQADPASWNFTIADVPLGNYISMEFIIGVDSARNCSGAQTGALEATNDMFWDWAQGYIFAKMEGDCNRANGGGFIHHIGGLSGTWNAIVKSKPSFGSNMIQVMTKKTPTVYIKADVLEWFKNPTTIDLANYGSVSMGKKAHEVAANYADMFKVDAIVN